MWQSYQMRPEEFFNKPPETQAFYIASHEIEVERREKTRKDAETARKLHRK